MKSANLYFIPAGWNNENEICKFLHILYFIPAGSNNEKKSHHKWKESHHNEAVLQFWGACDIFGHHPWAKLWSDFIQLPACHLNPALHVYLPVNGQRLDDQEVNHSKHMSCLKMLVCLNLWDNCEVQQRQKETTSWRRNNNKTGQKQTDNHTPIETDWETNNGKPDCIGLVLGEGKLSGNLWVKEDIGGVRFEISDRQPNDSLALCSLERKY